MNYPAVKIPILAFFLLFLIPIGRSQSNHMDSLLKVASKEKNNQRKLLILNEAVSYGWYYGNYNKAIEIALDAKKIAYKFHNDSLITLLSNNLGICYDYTGEYDKAIHEFYEALKISERNNDANSEAYALSNLGLIFNKQGMYEKALQYHTKSLKIRKKHGNKTGISASMNNLAITYMDMKKFNKAIYFFNQAVSIDQTLHDSAGLSDDYNNLGVCYENTNKFTQALSYHQLSLEIKLKLNQTLGIANSWYNIGVVEKKQGQFSKAIIHLKQAETLADSIGSKELQSSIYDNLREIYAIQHNYKLAFNYSEKQHILEDELDNEEIIRSQTQSELTYQFEKKEAKQKMEQMKLDLDTKKKQELATIIIISIIFVLLIILIFTLMLLRRWREVKNQKQIIEEKSRQVESKNNEILDSITYAKRIQTAILPSSEVMTQIIPKHFVFYLPKDIVAGDFYWIEEAQDRTFLAVADCTGHGVPGAMMSVVCHNALNRAVKEFKLSETGEILNKTREIIIDELSKNQQDVYDGMDISLISWGSDKCKITWSGANNALWIWRQHSGELHEFKPDKQPIGKFAQEKPFTTHSISLEPEDKIFLFTDGYADQFGGVDSKKLKSKNFKRLIGETSKLSFEEQGKQLNTFFQEWKGNLEQIDDICVLGLTLN